MTTGRSGGVGSEPVSSVSPSQTTTPTHSARSSESHAEAIRVLKAFFEVRNVKVTADALRMWVDALSDLTHEQLVDAVRRFNRESTEYPTPAAVRRYAGGGSAVSEDRARVAWSVVRREIRRTGGYESIEFDDQVTNATIRAMGGWDKLCEVTEDTLPFRERDFLANYMAICRTGIGDGRPLVGIVARTNAGNGFKKPEPMRIETGLAPHPVAARLGHAGSRPGISQASELAKRLTVRDE